MVPLRIRVSDRRRAEDLLGYPRSLGADAWRQGEAITVMRGHPRVTGEPPNQDRMELEFVLRLWAGGRPEIGFEVEEAA